MSFIRVLQRSPPVCSFCTARNFSSTTASLSNAPEKTSKTPSSTASSSVTLLSSCAADTVLEGVNYLKAQPPVLARPDEEYPDWLWSILKPKVWPDDGPGGKLERVKRRQENKKRIKDKNFMSTQ